MCATCPHSMHWPRPASRACHEMNLLFRGTQLEPRLRYCPEQDPPLQAVVSLPHHRDTVVSLSFCEPVSGLFCLLKNYSATCRVTTIQDQLNQAPRNVRGA